MAWLIRGLGRITGAFGGRDGSQTAQRVAAIRAGFDRPSTPEGNDDAQRLLCRGMSAPARAPWLRPHLLARTRFFDEATLAAIARGVTQVVILGAGYDDRALRFRAPGVRFFELDHPATQADKRRRLIAGGLVTDGLELIAADFKHEDVSALLERAVTQPGATLSSSAKAYWSTSMVPRSSPCSPRSRLGPARRALWPRASRSTQAISTRGSSPRQRTRAGGSGQGSLGSRSSRSKRTSACSTTAAGSSTPSSTTRHWSLERCRVARCSSRPIHDERPVAAGCEAPGAVGRAAQPSPA